MKKLSLVVLAAGMGSRYGGLKQLDTMTLEGDTIIDFSLYDAIEAGFTKIVFVIRKSFESEFKKQFDKKLKDKVELLYVYQEVNDVPEKFNKTQRTKPWGTAHALLMVKNVVDENFAVINADDFYGKESFNTMAIQLKNTVKTTTDFYLNGYLLKNTISEFGAVSRGECFVDDALFLKKIIERTHIQKIKEHLFYKDKQDAFYKIDENTIVSMNFWGFTPEIFKFIDSLFCDFLRLNATNLTAEFFIPYVIDTIIKEKKGTVKVLQNNAIWLGVTYKEDKEQVVKKIAQLKNKKQYPKFLWQ